ncbi:MAG: VanZ family protein [marine benthic group bacterium]|jgi:hypothetical protein|nr:VanZ family protein [Gemmatimonadota bacterium]
MPTFTSDRERCLWFWAAAVALAIYSTLGLAGTLAGVLRERGLLDASYVVGLLLMMLATIGSAWRRRPGKREIWVAIAVTAVYGMIVLRMGLGPEERTHLIEYGILGVLIYQALIERRRNGAQVRSPAALAVLTTALLGLVDEVIQAILPNRVWDIRDVGFNALAGLMAVAASAIVSRMWRKHGQTEA